MNHFQITINESNAFARGKQYGVACKDRIAISMRNYAELFATECNLKDWSAVHIEARRHLAFLEANCAFVVDEMKGIAEGSQQDFLTIVAFNVRTEILARCRARTATTTTTVAPVKTVEKDISHHECTTLASVHAANKDRSDVFLSQNWDWYLGQRQALVVLKCSRSNDDWFHTVTEGGICGKVGLNSRGVAVSLNLVKTDDEVLDNGMPIHVLLHEILLNATCFGDAERIARRHATSSSSCITIIDRYGNGAALELSPTSVRRVELNSSGWLVHTNHIVGGVPNANVTPSSTNRFDRASALLGQHVGNIDVDTILAVLSDHEPLPICRHAKGNASLDHVTICSIVMNVATLQLYVTSALPCETKLNLICT